MKSTAHIKKTQEILSYIESVIGVGLALRLVMKLFGANSANQFVQLLYGLTQPLVMPFEGIFPAVDVGVGVVEPAAILGLILYPILVQLVQSLLQVVFSEK